MLPRSLVLVENAHAGHRGQGLRAAHEAFAREGLQVLDTIDMHDLRRLGAWVVRPAGERPLIVAAGGDGTIGSVAGYVINTDAVMGILPLGTHNDVARSLGIPMSMEEAVHVLVAGKVATVDGARFVDRDGKSHYFVQAAAIGIQVAFARRATKTSLRRRLGRLTYLAAAVMALRKSTPFACEFELYGRSVSLCLLHLSVLNAPVFGGLFDLRVPGSKVDDRRLDVLTIECAPLWRIVLGAVPVLLHIKPGGGPVRVHHVRRLRVQTEQPQGVSLDGEVCAQTPGEFVLVPEAVHIVAPPKFDEE